MHRLTGPDAGFLYVECETQPSQGVDVLVLPAPTPDTPALTMPELRAHVEARLGLLPSFHHRVERVPWGLHHPVLVEDPDFDLDYHLRHVELDPDDDGAFDRLVADLADQLLDRRHPLWKAFLVSGLPGGRQAIVLQLHHTICDGTALRTTFEALCSTDAEAAAAPPVGRPERPTKLRLALDALVALWRSLLRLPGLLAAAKRGGEAEEARKAESPIAVPQQDDVPVTLFNDAFSSGRRYARASVPLADLRTVRKAAGVTVNDVVLAMGAGATRRYLAARDALPEQPLTINVPVSTEPPDAPPRQWGNKFANYLSTLATDVDDPWERLRVISEVAGEGRERLDLRGRTLLADLLDNVPGFLAEPGARWMAAERRKHRHDKAEYNVILSNVWGEQAPLVFAGRPVDEVWVCGPTFEGAGVTLVAWTYVDRVQLSATTTAEAVDDPAELLAGMVDALAELVALAADRAPAVDATEPTGTTV